jgi:MFS family permease
MEHKPRKKILLTFMLFQFLIWLPIIGLGYLFLQGTLTPYLPLALIGLWLLFSAAGGAMAPAWFSWMGDLVSADHRGRYFSKRNRLIGTFGLIASLTGAILLDFYKTRGLAIIGFIILFGAAATFKLVAWFFLHHQYAPQLKLRKKYYFSFLSFIKRFDNLGKFATYRAFLNLSIAIAGPFLAVYMLQELGFSYTTFMIVSLSGSVFYLFFSPLAGKFSDRYGNIKLIWIANILWIFTPLLWTFLTKPLHLIMFPALISGIANACWVIAVTNFMYDSSSQEHRGLCVAYSSVLIGVGAFIGALIGGYLIQYVPAILSNKYTTIFALSAALRLIVGASFLPKLKEQKHTKRLPPMRIQFNHPFKTLNAEIGWFRHVFK